MGANDGRRVPQNVADDASARRVAFSRTPAACPLQMGGAPTPRQAPVQERARCAAGEYGQTGGTIRARVPRRETRLGRPRFAAARHVISRLCLRVTRVAAGAACSPGTNQRHGVSWRGKAAARTRQGGPRSLFHGSEVPAGALCLLARVWPTPGAPPRQAKPAAGDRTRGESRRRTRHTTFRVLNEITTGNRLLRAPASLIVAHQRRRRARAIVRCLAIVDD